ncbi:proteasome assembly chaperone family protein [Rathayibacter toxicus]|uniref:Carboxylate--amine ligase n=1 Tax=Rathayibacter toxicus TaxID=145458 RepID=A0A0C5BJD2_9MICO|nr:PAC2 family protein [Rathayibacter toxicus]AJM78415.1 carboxylate--amine ligase [Rathayibacter toxicus]ALS58389.1 carboxylate--amine ligase [Rathayibacter toxicus]KKM45398.1 carboxylate--amine ligase [Rathayibacter toxicus]PPG21956.1 PAC2 family protein [Rathayibacter toxicus]PPG46918.1 PAC2 family protein [Rathayibacter toxicus]
MNVIKGNVLVVAFEGWNDAGDAASGAVRLVKDDGDFVPLFAVDPEQYYDFQYTRPTLSIGEDGRRCLSWPGTQIFGPATTSADDEITPYVMLGTEPSRSWKSFATEVVDTMLAIDISTVVFLGAMLADVPHTRPISLFASSENAELRSAFDLERSNYEGPVGILSVIGETAAKVGIPAMTLWASVPHYVHSAPSPKATLALLEKLEEVLGVATPRGDLVEQAQEWERGINALAADDEDMASYIAQLEHARDTVDSPEASGEAIAQEFERYLRRRGDGRPGDEPRRS